MDLEAIIASEMAFFDSEDQRASFAKYRCQPFTSEQSWNYVEPFGHSCVVVAHDDETQIVWCATGFGPEFPWSTQKLGGTEMGMDSAWHAYLYEAFVTSTMWPAGPPEGFELMASGERARTDQR